VTAACLEAITGIATFPSVMCCSTESSLCLTLKFHIFSVICLVHLRLEVCLISAALCGMIMYRFPMNTLLLFPLCAIKCPEDLV